MKMTKEVSEGWFKRIWKRMTLKSKQKQELIDYIQNIEGVLDLNIDKVLNSIQSLDQNKVYHVQVEYDYEIKQVQDMFKLAGKKLQWTPPLVIVSTLDINVVHEAITQKDKDKLQEILREVVKDYNNR